MDCKQKTCRKNRNQMCVARVSVYGVCVHSHTPANTYAHVLDSKRHLITLMLLLTVCVYCIYAYIRTASGATCELFMHSKVALSAFKCASSFATLFFFLFRLFVRSFFLHFIIVIFCLFFSPLFLAADSHTDIHNLDDLDEVNNKKKE